MKSIELYTDGACRGNPGPGGYGCVLLYNSRRKELSGGFMETTNNRMELFAAIAGLEALREPCAVTLYSDSSYLVNAFNKNWLQSWKRNSWKTAARQPVRNVDLWQRLLDACSRHRIAFVWVRGHASNAGNNRCDELARAAAAGESLPVDAGYCAVAVDLL